ncbi:hypothetical protein PVK06_021556 [Gossypium arboreum]|uniref:Uncharacterized protein n=1 Tax=Gossypium arboreum TaxID=29729 RepID=A0ABR0PQU8_GOSAR|nr:hypothetical protein PVK06_021556 [Gossypium arboreum]
MGKGTKRAVLVGCNYPKTQFSLHGCIDDVNAIRDVILKFGFKESDVNSSPMRQGRRFCLLVQTLGMHLIEWRAMLKRHSTCSVAISDVSEKLPRDVWTTTTRLFATLTGAMLFRLRHELHSLKKGNLSIKDYIEKIQNTSVLIEAFGSRISEAEKVETVLTGLPPKFKAVITLASFSSKPLPLQHLVDVLIEYKNRQMRAVQDVPLHANLLESDPLPALVDSVRGGRPPSVGRGKGFRGVYNSGGPHGTSLPNGSIFNNVEVAPAYGFGLELGPSSAGVYNGPRPFVPWRTKPKAQVYTGSDPCIRLPRIPDVHASDLSNTSGSNVHATQFSGYYGFHT